MNTVIPQPQILCIFIPPIYLDRAQIEQILQINADICPSGMWGRAFDYIKE